MKRRQAITYSFASMSAVSALHVKAQSAGLPNPLRIVVGYPPGGTSDRSARLIADRLQSKLGISVIVENRPGAGGRLAPQQLAKTPANQIVLMMGNPAQMTLAPVTSSSDIGYNPDKDFVPLAFLSETEFAIAVGKGLPLKQTAHLMAWIAANPDKANIGVPATGTMPHFFALTLGYMTNSKLEAIGYRGSGPMINDLVGGQIPIAIDSLDSLLPQHESGAIRILATSNKKRSSLLADVNTFREAGIPIVATGWNIVFAPSSTPKPIQTQLSNVLIEIMSEPAVQARFRAAKMDPVVMNQKQTLEALSKYHEQWRTVVKRSGFKVTN